MSRVFHGQLFHNSAAMSKGFSWCPTSLLDIPLAQTSPALDILGNGDFVGDWRVFSLDDFPQEYNWKDTHPLIRVAIQLALKCRDEHLFLVEPNARLIARALLVQVMRKRGEKTPRDVNCKFVGPVYFLRPQYGNKKGEKMEVRIGDVGGMDEIDDEKAIEYIFRVATPKVQGLTEWEGLQPAKANERIQLLLEKVT